MSSSPVVREAQGLETYNPSAKQKAAAKLSRIPVKVEPGEVLEVRLRPAPDDRVDTPDDVAAALRAADMTATWEALTPGKRRGLLYQIATAKTAPTRLKRIAALIQTLSS